MTYEKQSIVKSWARRAYDSKWSSYVLIGAWGIIAIVFTMYYTQPTVDNYEVRTSAPAQTVISVPNDYNSPTDALQTASGVYVPQPANYTAPQVTEQSTSTTAAVQPTNVTPMPQTTNPQPVYAPTVYTEVQWSN